ncbi:MAG: hypothetical protein ACKOFI_11830, partial [Phycisphaerales bacterium]
MATRTKKKSESPAADDEAPTSLIPGLEAPPARPYTVLARRYRSRDFGEVVGQEPIARTLRNAIETGRTAHAYLFCGTRGVGKTSMARILARAPQPGARRARRPPRRPRGAACAGARWARAPPAPGGG